jgi:hypothetical protein
VGTGHGSSSTCPSRCLLKARCGGGGGEHRHKQSGRPCAQTRPHEVCSQEARPITDAPTCSTPSSRTHPPTHKHTHTAERTRDVAGLWVVVVLGNQGVLQLGAGTHTELLYSNLGRLQGGGINQRLHKVEVPGQNRGSTPTTTTTTTKQREHIASISALQIKTWLAWCQCKRG